MLVKQIATAALAFGCSIGIASAEAEVGKAAFTQYCATCHGVDAQGAGDLTEIMTVKVPDLTQLAVNNDGKFPMLEVIHVIDGRTGLRGHGGPMPTYGALFDEEASGSGAFGGVLYTRGKILSIAYYLESLQNQ